MTDPLEIIAKACWLADRFLLRISPLPTGNLRLEDGIYLFGSGTAYFPLEAVLVCANGSGDWRADVATVLGVDQEWISGFLDGFAQESENSTDQEYVQGFLTAEQLRTTRYRRELPNRPLARESN